MKKVAIVAYFFHEDNIVGSIRARGLAKYLSEFGWRPTIITRGDRSYRDDKFDVIGVDFTEFDRALVKGFDLYVAEDVVSDKVDRTNNLVNLAIDLWNNVTQIPDAQRGWDRACYSRIAKMCKDREFDAVITTSGPFSSHLLGARVKRKFGIPWIADLRDLWSQNHFYIYSKYRNKLDTMIERKVLRDADFITSVSNDLVGKLHLIHEAKEIRAIKNGYDPQEFEDTKELDLVFSLVYAGKIYEGNQDFVSILEVISDLLKRDRISRDMISLEFFGADLPALTKMIRDLDLGDIVKNNTRIPRKMMVKKLMGTQLLLLLPWNDPEQKGVISGKIFDYLAAKRPILSSGHYDDEATDMIRELNAGVHCKTREELETALLNRYDEFITTGKVDYHGHVQQIEQLSHRKMAQSFACLLDESYKKHSR